MIKNILGKVLLVSLLISSSLVAELVHKTDSSSLIGIELGSAGLDVSDDSTPAYNETLGTNNIAFKIGAETKTYRLFLNYCYYDGSDFENMTTMGAEFQYLVNLASFMNIYLGVNVGIADIEYIDNSSVTRTVSQQYMGGNIGSNFHIGDSFDFELGAKIMSIQAEHTLNNQTYLFGNITSGYASLIYKYQID